MVKHLYPFEKQKIKLFNNIFRDICIYGDYYRITTVNCIYQKLSASESSSATHALSCSCLSYFLAGRSDF
jgi:hypothetical protein